MTGFVDELFGHLGGLGVTRVERLRDARRQCAANGHRYAVVGSKTPTKVMCRRCEDTWAIGARTAAAE